MGNKIVHQKDPAEKDTYLSQPELLDEKKRRVEFVCKLNLVHMAQNSRGKTSEELSKETGRDRFPAKHSLSIFSTESHGK